MNTDPIVYNYVMIDLYAQQNGPYSCFPISHSSVLVIAVVPCKSKPTIIHYQPKEEKSIGISRIQGATKFRTVVTSRRATAERAWVWRISGERLLSELLLSLAEVKLWSWEVSRGYILEPLTPIHGKLNTDSCCNFLDNNAHPTLRQFYVLDHCYFTPLMLRGPPGIDDNKVNRLDGLHRIQS
ncbi:hypothetical protein TNCV_2829081 [Trichonephila clavipes]|nr:hypothetical protein TNCV_2829081 [Trichonephila clavipes]